MLLLFWPNTHRKATESFANLVVRARPKRRKPSLLKQHADIMAVCMLAFGAQAGGVSYREGVHTAN